MLMVVIIVRYYLNAATWFVRFLQFGFPLRAVAIFEFVLTQFFMFASI